MKYQVLRAYKTKNKLVKLCDSLQEAHNVIKKEGVPFMELSYIGNFPTYASSVNKKVFQIQGLHEGFNIVLGLAQKELDAFDFTA